MNTPQLETQRLILRRFTEADREALLRIFSDGEANRFLPWFPVKSLEEALAFYKERYAPVYAKAQATPTPSLPQGGQRCHWLRQRGDRGAGTCYGLRKEFWGQGIVTEASRAVLAQMKEDGVPLSPPPTIGKTPAAAK